MNNGTERQIHFTVHSVLSDTIFAEYKILESVRNHTCWVDYQTDKGKKNKEDGSE